MEQQRAIYGTSLAERFGFVMQSYGLSQRALARVLGLSAPMLSQLISAQRIKIGNPAVYGRLLMLEARVDQEDRDRVLREVEQADPVTATQSSSEPTEEAEQHTLIQYLRRTTEPAALAALATQAVQLGAADLAQVLQLAAAPESKD